MWDAARTFPLLVPLTLGSESSDKQKGVLIRPVSRLTYALVHDERTDMQMLMYADEAAEVIGVGKEQVKAWMDAEPIPLPTVKVGKRRKIIMARVPEWLDMQSASVLEMKRRGYAS